MRGANQGVYSFSEGKGITLCLSLSCKKNKVYAKSPKGLVRPFAKRYPKGSAKRSARRRLRSRGAKTVGAKNGRRSYGMEKRQFPRGKTV